MEIRDTGSTPKAPPTQIRRRKPHPAEEQADTFVPGSSAAEPGSRQKVLKSLSAPLSKASKAVVEGDKRVIYDLQKQIVDEGTLWEFKKFDIFRRDTLYDSVNKSLYSVVGFDAGVAPPSDPYDHDETHLYTLYLTSFNPDGTVKWAFKDATPVCDPVIDSRGNVYIRSSENLHVVDSNGKEISCYDTAPNKDFWRTYRPDRAPSWISSPPVLGKDGKIYIITGHEEGNASYGNNMRLLCLKDGKELWHYDAFCHNFHPSVAAGDDGSVSLSCSQFKKKLSLEGLLDGRKEDRAYLVGLRPDGTESYRMPLDSWNATYGQAYEKNIITGPDSTVYASHDWNRLSAFSPKGKKKWTYALKEPINKNSQAFPGISGTPAFDREGNIYIATFASKGENRFEINGDASGSLIKLDRNGRELWNVPVSGGGITGNLRVGDDGRIYASTPRGYLKIFDGEGNEKGSYLTGTSNTFGIGDEGELFIGDWNRIFAFQPDQAKLPERPQAEEPAPVSRIDDEDEFVVIDGIKLDKKSMGLLRGDRLHV